jgi:pyruvate dehydrogenase E2 component (dihydrolipoamide acetyltransferase)
MFPFDHRGDSSRAIESARVVGGGCQMSVKIEMPELSSEGEGATLATWLVAVGDRVEQGEVIAELETDKATVELEAPSSGTIAEFAVAEGTEGILPGVVLATLDAGVDVEPANAGADSRKETISAEAKEGPVVTPVVPAQPDAPDVRNSSTGTDLRESTPLARRAAVDRDVDLGSVSGSGPGGRVVVDDVLRTADSGSPAARVTKSATPAAPTLDVDSSFTAVRLTAMRKTIARRMTESKQQVPHFYLRLRCRMDAVMEMRAQLNRELQEADREIKISVNDFIVRAAALALRDVPEANVQFADHEMHVFDRVDVSVAVATDGGLVTPVIRDADRKGLTALATEVKALAIQARDGKLRPEQYQGGTFTISNLGMYGVETVYPILNPPQACILGVGAAEEQPVVRDGKIEIGWIAALTLAADHRAVDGAVGARLLSALRERLDDPLRMML